MELNTLEHASEGPEVGPPLIVAHGLFGSARNFNTLGRKLAVGRRVILVDMRNHGESPWGDDVSYTAMADDLAGVIDRAGGRATVLGHSMGGKATMALALTRPELLAGVIVADIAPVAYGHTHQPFIEAMMAMDLSKVSKRSDADPFLAEAVENPMLRAFLLQNLVFEEGRPRWRLNLEVLNTGMDTLIGWPDALDAKPFEGPTFFLYGGSSDYMKIANEARAREVFPNAEFQALEGAGHWLHAEKPAEFIEAVDGWLSRLEA